MNLWLERLVELMPPPNEPVNPTDDATWSEVEDALGVVFPADFKEFDRIYGKGTLNHELYFAIPSPGRTDQFLEHVAKSVEQLGDRFPEGWEDDSGRAEPARTPLPSRLDGGESAESSLFPAAGGLLEFASDHNGNAYYLVVRDGVVHEDSPIVVDQHGFSSSRYDGGFGRFLVDAFERSIDVPTLAGDQDFDWWDPLTWVPSRGTKWRRRLELEPAAMTQGEVPAGPSVPRFDTLFRKFQPPRRPSVGTRPWEEAEDDLGFAFPDSYRQLIERYGSGSIQGIDWCDPRDDLYRDWVAGAFPEPGLTDPPRPCALDHQQGLVPLCQQKGARYGPVRVACVVVADGIVRDEEVWFGAWDSGRWTRVPEPFPAVLTSIVCADDVPPVFRKVRPVESKGGRLLLPVSELSNEGVVIAATLVAAGVSVEVLPRDHEREMRTSVPAELLERLPENSRLRRQAEGPDPALVLRVSRSADAQLVDSMDRRLEGQSTMRTEGPTVRTWDSVEGAVALEIRYPLFSR